MVSFLASLRHSIGTLLLIVGFSTAILLTTDWASAQSSTTTESQAANWVALLEAGNLIEQRKSIQGLLAISPDDISDAKLKKQIARAFRSTAFKTHIPWRSEAIRGLALWEGKYSVPLLIDLMEKERMKINEEIFHALARLKDPRGAEAVGRQIGNFFNNAAAVAALRKMRPVAEEPLLKLVPSSDPDVSLPAIQLLGELGGIRASSC